MKFTNSYREEIIRGIVSKEYDLIVIGGGITGAGILLDAQTRGLNAVLFDMQDFGAGTSSRSTKLIHGGLRYLKQMEFKLVAEVGKERKIVQQNSPHITREIRLLLPIYRGGSIGLFGGKLAMMIYEWVAKISGKQKHQVLSKSEALKEIPSLDPNGLKGAIEYSEYMTDDARLTLENIKEAVSRGANALNYAKVEGFLYGPDKQVCGVMVHDLQSGQRIEVKARHVINAVGPWTDEVCRLEGERIQQKLILTKGVHLVFSQDRFPIKKAVYFDVGDKRMVFAIPKFGKVYVGTTDTFFNENIQDPDITEADKHYLLNALAGKFPGLNLTVHDIESGWSGLRPLILEEGKKPSEISRKDEVFVSESGLISIAGGKLTGYRKMAEKVVDMISDKDCTTDTIRLSGGNLKGKTAEMYIKKAIEAGLSNEQSQWLYDRYGSEMDRILPFTGENQTDLPDHIYAALCYSFENEMVVNADDFLIRRTSMSYFNHKQADALRQSIEKEIERLKK